MKNNEEWKNIDDMRIADRDYSGMSYTIEYAENNKNKGDWWSRTGATCWVEEAVRIRRGNNREILYQITGRDYGDHPTDFNTQFGVFHSEDNGEFGGEVVTPEGNNDIVNNGWHFFLKQTGTYAAS